MFAPYNFLFQIVNTLTLEKKIKVLTEQLFTLKNQLFMAINILCFQCLHADDVLKKIRRPPSSPQFEISAPGASSGINVI